MTRQDDRDMRCGKGEAGRWKKLLFCLGLQESRYPLGRSGGEQISDYRCTVMLLLLRCIGNLMFCMVVFLFTTNAGMFIWYPYYQDCPPWGCYGNHHHVRLGRIQRRMMLPRHGARQRVACLFSVKMIRKYFRKDKNKRI